MPNHKLGLIRGRSGLTYEKDAKGRIVRGNPGKRKGTRNKTNIALAQAIVAGSPTTPLAVMLEAMAYYRRQWLKAEDKQRIWTGYPLHDWASHSCDALATFATGFEEPSVTKGQKRRNYDSYSPATHWAS